MKDDASGRRREKSGRKNGIVSESCGTRNASVASVRETRGIAIEIGTETETEIEIEIESLNAIATGIVTRSANVNETEIVVASETAAATRLPSPTRKSRQQSLTLSSPRRITIDSSRKPWQTC
jgi:hypothetical protein